MNLFQAHGAQSNHPLAFAPIFIDRTFTGLYTQRAVLHDPADLYTSRYGGGRPDALLGGRNVELTNRLTLQRRPGHVLFGGGATYPTPPLRAFSFQLANGNIQVIIDTGSSGNLAITSCNNASAGTTVYNGTFPGGAANGFVGLVFQVTGFVTNPTTNNGTFTCTASTSTTLTLNNANGIAETVAANAISTGGVFVDNQNGTNTLLFGKGVGAGQTQFISVAGVLYMGDGVEVKKYTPLNTNGTVWNWGIAAPVNPPAVTITQSGAAATVWQATTVFSTMGLTKDTNATPQIWQLIGVNADNTNTPTSQFGTSGNGEPNWNSATVEGQTVVDNTVTWQNAGAVSEWKSNGFYTDMGWFGNTPAPNFTQPAFANTSDLKTLYGNFKNSGSLGQTSTIRPPFNGAYPGPAGGYFAFNTHFFAVGTYATTAGMQAMRWKQSHVYAGWQSGGISNTITNGAPGFILTGNLPAPTGTTVYMFIPTTGGTSGSGYAPFPANAAVGAIVSDAQLQWMNLGQAAWQANHAYVPWQTNNVAFGCVFDGTNFQVAKASTGAGLSGAHQPGTALASAVSITAAISGQQTTYTLGAGSWTFTPASGDQIAVSGFVNAGNNTQNNSTFTVISATSNTIVVTNPGGVNETHSATITWNPWATGYGGITTDNNITWVCVGPNVAWAAAQTWHLPPNGFQPPSQSQQFGGSLVNGNNGFVQAVVSSGTSGGSQPVWKTTSDTPPTVTDGSITWQAISQIQSQSLAISFGLAWAYSYKARAVNDLYSPAPAGGGQTPPGSVVLGPPTGSGTNAISTASPALQIVGGNSGAVFTLTGDYSPDPQVDTIVIWRSADSASGTGAMFELTEIPNVPSLAGVKKWTFRDFLPSVANGTYPGLNILLPAPINGVNNPPLSSFLPMVYNFQRIWGANGQNVPFSGGPDTLVGNPNEAFLLSDNLPFLAPVIRLVRTSQGIVTFLTDSIEMIGGGPQTSSFFSVTMAPGIGLTSYNAADVFAGEIYFFGSDNVFRVITPSLNVASFGFPIGDQLANSPSFGSPDATWTPANVYVAVLQNGTDNCIMLADGSTGWYRLNPHQVPGGFQGPEPIWSPFAAITGGAKMVQAVEISPGQKRLLVGPTTNGGQILQRSTAVFTDNGTQYDAFFSMGSLTLAHPGQIALLRFLEFDFSGIGYKPTVSYLLNEISGTFTPFVNNVLGVPQLDPPEVYGATKSAGSYSPNRYYFAANNAIARCRHMQIKVDFGTTPNGDELYSMTVFGRFKSEL
jgi:hypothetical protein